MFPVLHNSREIFPSRHVVKETRMHRRFTLYFTSGVLKLYAGVPPNEI